jgi:hypothetical protein
MRRREPTRRAGEQVTVIERWTLHAHHAFDRVLRIKEGPLPEWRSDTRMVREADYDALAEQLREAVDLLATFVDDEPCRFDHHGYCQTHGWLDEGECNVARARRLIGGQ